ncbi:unnamed protein product [Heligmosomoides polygyrus]|uniref:C-type lectin domain-containing protein n=1 Tax=Heligmosomoides polygyrus TaxID=6339 RepID=A0A3P8AF78_HELPZ|nr:unnamed protein product [Heligmosomoides polygyrus]
MYGDEYWPTTKEFGPPLSIKETKILRWTAGVTRMNRIQNNAIRQKFGAALIADKEPSEPLMNDECPCNPFNIWLDVFFLIDSSSAMTSDGFDCATAFVESVLYRMNVGQAFGQQTRVGIITYGANAKLHYNLSYWQSSNDLLNSMNLPFHDSRGTNIEEGIRLATANFNPPQHRPNAKKVHGAPVLMLDSLATPGFELTNRHGEIQDDDFKMWAPNYPDSQQGDCVKMEKGDTEDAGLWYNDYCGVDLLYVCQIVSCSTEHYCPVIR